MKLKEYIKEKALFDSINTNDIKSNYANITKSLSKSKIEVDETVIDGFKDSITELDKALKEGYDKLQHKFYESVQPKNLARSYDLYDSIEYIRLKVIENDYWDEELQEIIIGTIKKYINYQYPGLEIMPRSKLWTKELTGMDPLFIASKEIDNVHKINEQFHPMFQRRIRVYDYEKEELSQLPQNTFGFIFSWGYFEHLPYDVIDRYLANIYNLLLPGGAFMVSYANCLLEKIASQFENNNYCYMTKELLQGLSDKNGLDFIEDKHYQFRTSWAIIKKPGELPKGIKENPSLGYVKNFSLDPIP